MEEKHLHIPYWEYPDSSGLPPEEQHLLEKAMEATQHAYAPYSDIHVGCAVELESGEIFLGNNQENPAYPSGLCAERTVFFHIGSLGKAQQIRRVAIRVRSETIDFNFPLMPCGACRQVMLSYEQQARTSFLLLMQGERGHVLKLEGVAKSLMPFGFEL